METSEISKSQWIKKDKENTKPLILHSYTVVWDKETPKSK
jgi:hypothetical protein